MSYPAWQVVAEVPIQTSLATPVPPRVLYCIASVDFSLTRGPKAVVARPQGSRREAPRQSSRGPKAVVARRYIAA